MKRILVIYGHPNPMSFSHAILDTLVKHLQSKQLEVVVRDLYALNFNPVLSAKDFMSLKSGKPLPDVLEEQKHMLWCDCMIIVTPVWWTGLPAIVKGYFDRTLTSGFAYKATPQGVIGLLEEKKALLLRTQGTPKELYEKEMWPALKLTSDVGIFDFCGVKMLDHVFFPAVPTVTPETRKNYLQRVEDVVDIYFGINKAVAQ